VAGLPVLGYSGLVEQAIHPSTARMAVEASAPEQAPLLDHGPSRPSRVRRLLAEPLLQFALIGSALFAAHAWASPTDAGTIVVDRARQAELVALFEQQKERKPSAAESKAMVNSWVEEEMLFRDGLALVEQDPVLRSAIVQRMRRLMHPELAPGKANEAELRQYYDDHRADYALPDRVRFTAYHIDAAPDAATRAAAMLTALRANQPVEANPVEYPPRSEADLVHVYAAAQAREIMNLPAQEWRLLTSERAVHLVRVEERYPARTRPLGEVRQHVTQALRLAAEQKQHEQLMSEMRARYCVQHEELAP